MSIDWHSDAWWMRIYDEDISPYEMRLWEAHLATCQTCRLEWAAMQRLDALMEVAPKVPTLAPDFTIKTLLRVNTLNRRRRIITYIAASFIVFVVAMSVFIAFGSAYETLMGYLRVLFSARYLLLSSMVQIMLGLIEGWRSLLPFLVVTPILIALLLMPNSLLVTLGYLWYSRRRQRLVHANR